MASLVVFPICTYNMNIPTSCCAFSNNTCKSCHFLASRSRRTNACKGDVKFDKLLSESESSTHHQKRIEPFASDSSKNTTDDQVLDTGQFTSIKGLQSLDAYFGKLNEDANSENYVLSASDKQSHEGNENPVAPQFSAREYFSIFPEVNNGRMEETCDRQQQQYDETSHLYLIGMLASINIAVFLFELASPIENSEFEVFSLPSLYGAKINDLILIGEWWRLLTPMFLHWGVFHIGLGCWVLVDFGPHVCRGYGSYAFLLLYILGGVSGNLTSFLHTPDLTVGGTGPVFSIIGAWLIHQMQNKDLIAKDVSDSMFIKAAIATVIGLLLSNAGPIDVWAHFGAAVTGIAYGFFTSPTVEVLEDASSSSSPPPSPSSSSSSSSSKRGQEEGIALVRRYSNPCKSLILFTLFIIVLSSLPLVIEPPL